MDLNGDLNIDLLPDTKLVSGTLSHKYGTTVVGKTVACITQVGGTGYTLQQAFNIVYRCGSQSQLKFGTPADMTHLVDEGVTWCSYMWMDATPPHERASGSDMPTRFSAGMPSTYVTGSSNEWPGCGVHGQIGIFYIANNTTFATAGDARYNIFISVSGNKTESEINNLLLPGNVVKRGQLEPGGSRNNPLLRYLASGSNPPSQHVG